MKRLVALMMCAVSLGVAAQTAPPTDSALVSQGWQLLLERNDHQYWLWDEDMEWEPARAMCESLGAYLYWPNDADEHDALWQTVPHGNDGIHFWTAIHQDFNVVSCADANGGWAGPNNEPQTFFLWELPGEPTNGQGKESVVQFEWSGDGKQWNDAPGQACDDGNNCDCRFSRVILERQTPTFCDDPAACNFIEGSFSDEGCDYTCCPGPGCCAEGMHWDWELGQCQNTLPGDTNGDGCVQLNDLLDLLSAYGDCAAEESPWQCGDPLEYQGYDYETVQIGEQCWFAENLRAENYENGDAIPAGLSDSDWSSATSGATAIFGEGISDCFESSPLGDSCEEFWSLSQYGRLYNWFAVDDVRGLCPDDWHVPTDNEWTSMTSFLGGESVAGTQMKSTDGWPGGNGTNSSGFSGLPGGQRNPNGYFNLAGLAGIWWSSTYDDSAPLRRDLYSNDEFVSRFYGALTDGLSVRCIKDAE